MNHNEQRNLKGIFQISLMALLMLLLSCKDDDNGVKDMMEEPDNSVPVTPEIDGAKEVDVTPEAISYTVPSNASSTYQWSISGIGTITGGTTSNSVEVQFGGEGSTTLTVVESNENGAGDAQSISITSTAGKPKVLRSFSESLFPIRTDSIDTLVIVFDRKLQTPPTFTLQPGQFVTTLGSLSSDTGLVITEEMDHLFNFISEDRLYDNSVSAYYAIYTAGEGNGGPNLEVASATALAEWGGKEMEIESNPVGAIVDNLGPEVEHFLFSSSYLKEGDDSLKITVKFNEPVDTIENVVILCPPIGTFPGYSSAVMDFDENDLSYRTVKFPTLGGDGALQFIINGSTDMAGNPISLDIYEGPTVDNTPPDLSNVSVTEITSESNLISMSATSSEMSTIYYTIVSDTIDIDSTSQVMDMSLAVLNGSFEVNANTVTGIQLGPVNSGEYNVYLFGMDLAGNESIISDRIDLTVD